MNHRVQVGKIITRVRARRMAALTRTHGMQHSDRQLDQFAEKTYFHELDAHDQIMRRLQIPLIAFLAISGLVGHMLQSLINKSNSILTLCCYVLLICSVVSLTVAAFYFGASIVGRTYAYLPPPSAWQAYHQRCVALYQDFEEKDFLVGAATQSALVSAYVDCATANRANNARRAKCLFGVFRSLIVATVFTFLAFIFFFVDAVYHVHQTTSASAAAAHSMDQGGSKPAIRTASICIQWA